jgi:membrane-anchored glycerophosphoryl diester phosphodiesterase (GDPDase)
MSPSAVIGFLLMQRLANLETLGRFDTKIASIASVPFFAVASGSVVLLVMSVPAGRDVGIASAIGSSLRHLVPLAVAVFLTWTGTWIGMLLLVVPGIILSVRLAMTIPVLMVEEIGPLEALKRSWALSRAHQLAIFGAFLPVWLVSGSLAIGAVLPFLDLSAGSVGNPFRNLSTASIALTSALSWCASTIGVVLLTILETVFYAQIAEQNHTEVFGQVAIPESDPGTV